MSRGGVKARHPARVTHSFQAGARLTVPATAGTFRRDGDGVPRNRP